ncbi:hypothetical protein Q3H58_001584 [Pseudomonas psychrotolerans]|nr:hypothetical protein [Pseudomonas psychrotolerans]
MPGPGDLLGRRGTGRRQEAFIELNSELANIWPNITEKKDALPDAAEWDGKPNKLPQLER